MLMLSLETLNLDTITFTVFPALNVDFAPMHRILGYSLSTV